MNEWDIQPNEPTLWFSRFEIFRQLGPRRTLEEAFRRDKEAQLNAAEERGIAPLIEALGKRPSPHWYEHSAKWNWLARAKASDAQDLQAERDKNESDKGRARRARRLQLGGLQGKMTKYLAEIELDQYSPYQVGQLINAVRTLNDDVRREYGDEPASRHELTGKDGNPLPLAISIVYENATTDETTTTE